MYKDKRWLCIIPARGGSKGIKNKNLRLVNGKSLLERAINTAKNAGIFDDIVVSTDSAKIAQTAKDNGIEVWDRPAELSDGTSKVMDAINFHLLWEARKWDMVQLLHCTNPLVTGIDILKAAKFAVQKDADFVVSICESDVPLGVAKPVPDDRCLTGWFPKELRQLNRQDITQSYQLDGNIYLGKYHVFLSNKDYWDTKIYGYEMARDKYCDINDEVDLQIADMRLKGLEHETKSIWRHLR